jgi:hypothetical protein
MSSEVPIVTLRQLKKTVGRGTESGALESTNDEAALGNALGVIEERDRNNGVLVAVDDPLASLLQTFLADKSQESEKLEPIDTGGLEATFDDNDWGGWAKSFFTWWRGIKPHPWLNQPTTKTIPNDARIAVLGDWGTGLYGAPVSARTVETDHLGYAVALHLGDVYYSGMEKEVQRQFLDVWPSLPNAIHRACNSNHEMYAGGHAYFNLTLPKFEQSASYFALENDHFVLAGLDTAYNAKDLTDDQVSWLTGLVASAGPRKVILFSHHQPYSTGLEKNGGNEKVVRRLQSLLESRKIFAWYWGHEHRCILYDPHERYGLHGRCVGHGGYPYFRDDIQDLPGEPAAGGTSWRFLPAEGTVPGARVLDGTNPYIPGEESHYGPQGHMTLELRSDQVNEIVHAPDGTILYEKELP